MNLPRRLAGLLLLAAAACRTPAPSQLRLGTARTLDTKSFAFDVIFLPDGQVGCALLERGEHRLVGFDRLSGRRRFELRLADGQDQVTSLAVSPSGKLLAAGLRELRQPPATASRPTLTSPLQGLIPMGSVVIVALENGRPRVLRRTPVPRPVLALAFVNEQQLAVGTAAVYRRDQGCSHQSLTPAGSPPCPAHPVPGTAGVCLLNSDGLLVGCVAQHADSVTSLVSIDGGLASGSWDGLVMLWGPQLQRRGSLPVGAPVNALAWAPRAQGGPLLAVATSRQPPRRSRALVALEAAGGNRQGRHDADRVELWRLADRRRLRVLHHHSFYVTELAVTADADLLVSGSWDFSVVLQRGSQQQRLDRFSQIITGLALSPEADALVVSAWTEAGSGRPSCLLLPISRPTSGSVQDLATSAREQLQTADVYP